MKERFLNFYSWVNNQGIEVSDKTNIFQCMDLAYSWVFFLNFPKSTIQRLYAYEVFTKPNDSTHTYFDIIPNSATFVPQSGDLAVFDKTANNIAGHISVCTGVGDTNSFQSLDQNWGGVSKATLVTHNYDNPKLLGVLRPKIADVKPSTNIDFGGFVTVLETYGIIGLDTLKSKLKAKDEYIKSKQEATTLPPIIVPQVFPQDPSVPREVEVTPATELPKESNVIPVSKFSLFQQIVDLIKKLLGV